MSGYKPRSRQRRRQAGITLLELLVCVVLIVILSLAVTQAFMAALDAERVFNRRQGIQSAQESYQLKITQMLQGAMLMESTTDTTTYFVGEYGNLGTTTQQTTNTATANNPGSPTATNSGSSSQSGSSGSNTSSNGTDLGCDRIVFTTSTPDVPIAIQTNTDDFETRHDTYGPSGGLAEVSLSMTAVGDAGDRTGLFQRLQRPSDGDATQGGTESLMTPDIQNIGFQFWDGTEWVDTWDSTTTPDTHRLPAAVLVSYVKTGDRTGTVYQFTVAIPGSNVTPDNPITTTTTGTTSSTTGR